MKLGKLGIAVTIAALSANVSASGLYLYEIGTEDVGLAAAGAAARGQDASTIAFNPAGMTRLDGNQLTFGAQALYGDVDYQLDGTGVLQGNSPGNVVGWFPGLSAFYSYSVNDRLKLGVGLYGNFGLGLHFGDWAGSQLIKDSTLLALTTQPTVAYRFNEQWSLGLGVGINYGLFSLKRESDTGEQKLDDHDWAINGKIGLLYEPSPTTRFGLAYTSKTDYDFQVSTDVTLTYAIPNPIPGRPDLTLSRTFSLPLEGMVDTPQQLMVSMFHQIDPSWAILANVGWQDWSVFNDNAIFAANREIQGSDRLQDTWHIAFGVQHQVNDNIRVNTGLAYDSSFYKHQDNTSLTMPSGEAWRFGVGAQYQLDKNSSLGTAFEYLRMEKSSVPSVLLSGNYDASSLYFFTANYSYRF